MEEQPQEIKAAAEDEEMRFDNIVVVVVYTGENYIRQDVTHVRVDPTIRQIHHCAFFDCTELKVVELNEGLEILHEFAFSKCSKLERINIPSTVRSIGNSAFVNCKQLMEVELCEGLEIIHEFAFSGCLKLQRINIPSTVKSIGNGAFSNCTQLMEVEICEGLEIIHEFAFSGCFSLERVSIPSTVEFIHYCAFKYCPRLEAVVFCEEIEAFLSTLSAASREWWNHGISPEALVLYRFLMHYNIPNRMVMMHVKNWKMKIYDMLMSRPPVVLELDNEYFASIDSKITVYESLWEPAVLLELAIWKSKLNENNSDLQQGILDCATRRTERARYLTNCGSNIIVPKVLSFLE